MYGLPKDFDCGRLVGKFLVQVCFGLYQVQLHFHPDQPFSNEPDLKIFITGKTLYRDSATSEVKVVDFPAAPAVYSELLKLLHHTTVHVFGDNEGTLTLEFDDGQILQCLDDNPAYEAYEIRLGGELIIV